MRNTQSLPKKTFGFIHKNPCFEKHTTQPVFFTRNRSLSFPVVLSAIPNLFKESVAYNISVFSPDMEITRLGDMTKLYDLRCGIEEGFKKLKPKMKPEHFGGRKPAGIFQEFEAHIFLMNLVAIMGTDAQEIINRNNRNKKIRYTYN